jgi:hypothetical protein
VAPNAPIVADEPMQIAELGPAAIVGSEFTVTVTVAEL